MRNRDPHRGNVENILAICHHIVTMQHMRESVNKYLFCKVRYPINEEIKTNYDVKVFFNILASIFVVSITITASLHTRLQKEHEYREKVVPKFRL